MEQSIRTFPASEIYPVYIYTCVYVCVCMCVVAPVGFTHGHGWRYTGCDVKLNKLDTSARAISSENSAGDQAIPRPYIYECVSFL